MEKFTRYTPDNEIFTLRESIKARYQTYHAQDRVKYPAFNFNTNRANYEPLRESFEEELFVRGGIDRQQKSIHIPSTYTLVLLFTADGYMPDRKILETCFLYAEGSATDLAGKSVSAPNVTTGLTKRLSLPVLTGLIVLFGLGSYFLTLKRTKFKQASGLHMHVPFSAVRYPRLIPIEGEVSNADTVWLVVKPDNESNYYVAYPAKVNSHGHWRVPIVIGDSSLYTTDRKFQVRAFVNPEQTLFPWDVLHKWPKAELASDIKEIIRRDERYIFTDDITIYYPSDVHIVPHQLVMEGKAMNADTVWVVIRPVGDHRHWVQPPIKVEKNGQWKGVVYVGDPGDTDICCPYQIRAFVKPVDPLKFNDMLYEWPKAERSSRILNVHRGPKIK
ncbi:hypothetical protein GCM10028803_61680 [Larkinella knui]|uniref:Uncharacterized protein n=1 Tax=Larkinella knui TaxID=2025310 RepID=A0A3P1CB00_9BACT|nr:hypothetical protein [Larkinella knui]RRB10499.1 hypothetical protein EHT87_30235 [Larkinella knui]